MIHRALEQQDITGVEDRRSDPEKNAKPVTLIQRTQIDPRDEKHPH